MFHAIAETKIKGKAMNLDEMVEDAEGEVGRLETC